MAQTVDALLRENIYSVFGEHDAAKRRVNIARLWAMDGVFIDSHTRYEGHPGIEHAAALILEKFPKFVFTERGKILAYNGIGKLDWNFGPAGEAAVITGSDVLVMQDGKISALYAFIELPKT